MTTREQRIQRKLTRAFIQTSPRCIQLVPYSRLRDDQGGWRYTRGETRPEQTFRFIEAGQPGSNATRNDLGVDGVRREYEFELLGEYCAVIDVGDRFTIKGVEYEVTDVWTDNGWETRASLIRRAPSTPEVGNG